MAEASRFWTTSGTGDGPAGGYTAAQFSEFVRQTLMTSLTTEGVLKGIGNELAVSGTSSPLTVASGSGLVYGFLYANDAPITAGSELTIPTPTTATRIDRIVLRASWSTQTIRVFRIAGTEGGAAPGLTQIENITWDIPLATVSITTGGVITITDARTFVKTPGTYGYLDDANIINALQLVSNAVTEAKINAGAVTEAKIGTGAVTEAKIGIGAVTSGKIGANAVVSGKIAADAVTTAAILNGTVTSDKLVSSAVIEAKIATGAVTADKIGSSAVITLKIANEAVTNAKLGPGAVTASKIATTTVTGGSDGNIALSTITSDNIAASTITGAKIATGTITGGWNGTAATGNIQLSTITSANIADNAIIEAKIATGAVTVNKIGAGAVTSAKIGQNQVFGGSTGNIASLTITADNIAANAVTNAKIIDDAVTSAKIIANAVTSAKIVNGGVTSEKIASVAWSKLTSVPSFISPMSRQGNSITAWPISGTTDYDISSVVASSELGSIALSFSSSTTATATVTFNIGFAYLPIVYVTSDTSALDAMITVSVRSINTTSFTVKAYSAAALTGTVYVYWLALGRV